jgi:uncharacterized membrane protein YkoI
MVLCLTAETPQQQQAITQLKAKFGAEANIEFQSGKNLIRTVQWHYHENVVTDLAAARAKAEQLFAEMEPYTHITMSDVDSVMQKDVGLTKKNLVIYYYQKKFGDINFEQTPYLFFSFEENGRYSLGTNFIYDFVLPERPYVSYERLEEIARNEYEGIILDDNAYGKDYTLHHRIDLYLCKFEKDNQTFYKVAYRITFPFYTIYVDAKNGEVIEKGCYNDF